MPPCCMQVNSGPFSEQVAGRVEAAHMRWLRKVTGEFRSVAEGRSNDQDARITYEVPSTWPQLAYTRLRYLSSL